MLSELFSTAKTNSSNLEKKYSNNLHRKMDFLEKLREDYDRINIDEDFAIIDAKLAQHSELPLIHSDTKDRLLDLETQLRIVTIDVEKKILNTYKNLLKVKWIPTNDDRYIENITFNDRTGYLNLVKMEATDPYKTEKLWDEMCRACSNLCECE